MICSLREHSASPFSGRPLLRDHPSPPGVGRGGEARGADADRPYRLETARGLEPVPVPGYADRGGQAAALSAAGEPCRRIRSEREEAALEGSGGDRLRLA